MARRWSGTRYNPDLPWRAAVKDIFGEHYLGSYATKEEAEQVEEAYRHARTA